MNTEHFETKRNALAAMWLAALSMLTFGLLLIADSDFDEQQRMHDFACDMHRQYVADLRAGVSEYDRRGWPIRIDDYAHKCGGAK